MSADDNKVSGLDDDSVSGSISLVSKDSKDFSLDKKYAFISNLVKTSMDADATATEGKKKTGQCS